MQAHSTTGTPRLVLNRKALDKISRAAGIRSEVDLAKHIGVDTATLWRVSTDVVTPSNSFIARCLAAFPQVQMEQLFRLVRS